MTQDLGPSTASNTPTKPISVLFVCLGNICRSPMAEAIFRHLTASLPPTSPLHATPITIDSAGTSAYHLHAEPDARTMSTLRRHGITDYTHAARKVCADDFERFGYVLAMDGANLRDLEAKRGRSKGSSGAKGAQVRLIGDFLEDGGVAGKVGGGEVVGDPYYGGDEGFERVYEQLLRLEGGFLRFLEREVGRDGEGKGE
ncbi:hypothetical protein GX48_08104 [Paracoccidioides brasiliensis]|nr:hypothetical protein GX48_08104 [Paracoccidioides brasiliensis]